MVFCKSAPSFIESIYKHFGIKNRQYDVALFHFFTLKSKKIPQQTLRDLWREYVGIEPT